MPVDREGPEDKTLRELHSGRPPDEIEFLKHPTREDLRMDPEWAALLDQGFEFKTQIEIGDKNDNDVVRNLQQQEYEVKEASAYLYGNPASGKREPTRVAIFAKKTGPSVS